VGKSQTVYLEKPSEEKPIEPFRSEDLPKTPAYEEEPEISSEDVENNLGESELTDEDRFTPFNVEPDSEFSSTGMTFEQIARALEVVQGKNADDKDQSAVARSLYEIEGSQLFDFLAMQAENEATIERLLKENLDDAGEILPKIERKKRREIAEFDMEKYV
jgi:hypothetical protein